MVEKKSGDKGWFFRQAIEFLMKSLMKSLIISINFNRRNRSRMSVDRLSGIISGRK